MPCVAIGAAIDYAGNDGFLPLTIRGGQIRVDRPIPIRGDVSSIFDRSVARLAAGDGARWQAATIEVVGELISKPLHRHHAVDDGAINVKVAREGWTRFTVPGGEAARYRSPGQ